MANNYLRMNGKLMKFNDKLLTVTTGGGAAYPTDGLIERWDFNDTLVGVNGYTWSADVGTIAYTTGKIGKCLDFTGGSIALQNSESGIYDTFTGTNTFSISCWLYSTVADGQYVWRSGDGNKEIIFGWNAAANCSPARHQPGVVVNVAEGTAAVFGESAWKHFVITYDGTTLKGYVDDSADSTVVSSISINTTNWALGGDSYGYYDGYVDLLYIYDKALSTDEIAQLYNGGSGV